MPDVLAEQAKVLADRVGALTLAAQHLDHRINRGERVQIFVVFGLLLNLLLCVAVALVVVNQISAAAKLGDAVQRETVTRQQGVCPIYALLIGTFNPGTRTAGPDRDAYIGTFQRLDEAYRALECNIAPVPPRADQTPIPIPKR